MTIIKNFKVLSFFILSLAIFTYQNLLGPTFSTLLTGLWQAWVAIPSFLGIGIGLWVSLTFFRQSSNLEKIERLCLHSLFYTFIIVCLLLAFFSNQIDLHLISMAENKTYYIEELMNQVVQSYVPLLLFLVSLPFFCFGLILGVRFSNINSAIVAYRIEIIGLLLGSLFCMWLLESWSWASVVVAICSLNFAAVFAFEYSVNRIFKALLKSCVVPALALIGFINFSSLWVIQRNPHLIYRDFTQKLTINILDTQWKSFAKVQLAELVLGLNKSLAIAIGDGTGIARYQKYDMSDPTPSRRLTVDLVAAAQPAPKKVAVLFSGAGVEVVGLHRTLGLDVETWGVEINSAILSMTAAQEGASYTEFFKKYNSHQVLSDNRRFLETTNEMFDTILYSWSGATVANFSGAILHTTQYSFTEQAISAAIGRLNPNGRLIIMGGNKLNIIKNLKNLESNQQISDVKNKVLIFGNKYPQDWKVTWDNLILFYKNGPWDASEIEKLKEVASSHNYALNVSADHDSSEAKAFLRLLASTNFSAESEKLWDEYRVFPQLATDNYPFAYRNVPSLATNKNIELKGNFIENLFPADNQLLNGMMVISFVLLLVMFVSTFKKDVDWSRDLFHFLAWAPLSCAALLFFLYKAILYFGEPTMAFLVVQTATQLGSLVGLLMAAKIKKMRVLNAFFFAGVITLLGAAYLAQIQSISSALFHMDLFLTIGTLVFVVGFISFSFTIYFMSNFFKTDSDKKNFGLFWTFETILCGLVSLAGVILIEEVGLNLFVLLFVASAAILILPKKTHT
ncbi:MAG: hypothetical protein H7256_10990 [Bdellovibrio sp.]|nr:hypothetical protein [Bdellovibrio sp.]